MRFAALLVCLLLAGCSSLTRYQPQSYVVRSGDTLYSIAWRHGVDHRDLARWNGLSNPDRLAIGQRLLLGPGGAAPVSRSTVAAPVARPAGAAPVASNAASTAPRFDWPLRGPVTARFGERGVLTTGIAIAGERGSAVRAAAPGRVVYAGGGLPDYGRLVIIQHNASWLTAYGHNQTVLVSQGQTVARGQEIGAVGLGPDLSPRLYFEIRRNGDPLDPLTFLAAD